MPTKPKPVYPLLPTTSSVLFASPAELVILKYVDTSVSDGIVVVLYVVVFFSWMLSVQEERRH